MSVQAEDETQLETMFNNLAEGGTITLPLAVQFWGDKFGMLKDKFGMNWMFNCPKK